MPVCMRKYFSIKQTCQGPHRSGWRRIRAVIQLIHLKQKESLQMFTACACSRVTELGTYNMHVLSWNGSHAPTIKKARNPSSQGYYKLSISTSRPHDFFVNHFFVGNKQPTIPTIFLVNKHLLGWCWPVKSREDDLRRYHGYHGCPENNVVCITVLNRKVVTYLDSALSKISSCL